MIVWEGERIEELRRIVEIEKRSAAKAAEHFGCTRNSIISACHRRGIKLAWRSSSGSLVQRIKETPRPKLSKVRKPPRVIELPPIEVPSLNVTFAELEPFHCRAITEGEGYQALFCGHRVIHESSYCRWHHSIFYTKPEPRRSQSAYRVQSNEARHDPQAA